MRKEFQHNIFFCVEFRYFCFLWFKSLVHRVILTVEKWRRKKNLNNWSTKELVLREVVLYFFNLSSNSIKSPRLLQLIFYVLYIQILKHAGTKSNDLIHVWIVRCVILLMEINDALCTSIILCLVLFLEFPALNNCCVAGSIMHYVDHVCDTQRFVSCFFLFFHLFWNSSKNDVEVQRWVSENSVFHCCVMGLTLYLCLRYSLLINKMFKVRSSD